MRFGAFYPDTGNRRQHGSITPSAFDDHKIVKQIVIPLDGQGCVRLENIIKNLINALGTVNEWTITQGHPACSSLHLIAGLDPLNLYRKRKIDLIFSFPVSRDYFITLYRQAAWLQIR